MTSNKKTSTSTARDTGASLISANGTAMFRSLVGESAAMGEVRRLIGQLAGSQATVLVTGESGTGKEIVARNLHYHSDRGEGPFVAVNCAAASARRFAQRLLGDETGGGYLAEAEGGTLFLDVIDEMPLAVQAMILPYLEGARRGDARIIAATQTDLEARRAAGSFREDLYYRLSVMPIHLPALREHPGDIPALLHELGQRIEHKTGNSIRFNAVATLALQRYQWPGNVRELANLAERLSILKPEEVIGLSDLPAAFQLLGEDEIRRFEEGDLAPAEEAGIPAGDAAVDAPRYSFIETLTPLRLEGYLDSFEKHLIQVALDDCAGNLGIAAERLQLTPQVLREKIARHGLQPALAL